jgi:hypothetical protein
MCLRIGRGIWRVSIVGSQANDRWEMKIVGPNAFERSYVLEDCGRASAGSGSRHSGEDAAGEEELTDYPDNPTNFLPSLFAARHVVPAPTKGSKVGGIALLEHRNQLMPLSEPIPHPHVHLVPNYKIPDGVGRILLEEQPDDRQVLGVLGTVLSTRQAKSRSSLYSPVLTFAVLVPILGVKYGTSFCVSMDR